MSTHPAYSASGSWPSRVIATGHREGKVVIREISEDLSVEDRSVIDTKIDSVIDSISVEYSGNFIAVSDYYKGIIVYSISGEQVLRDNSFKYSKVTFSRDGNWVWGMADGVCCGIEIASGAKSIEKCSQIAFSESELVWRVIRKSTTAFIRVPLLSGVDVDVDTGAFDVVEISVYNKTAALTLAGGDAMVISPLGVSQKISSDELSGYAIRCACVGDNQIVFSCCDREQNIFFLCFDQAGNPLGARQNILGRKGWTAWLDGSSYWFIEPNTLVEI